MKKNLNGKILAIVAVLLVCLYGIVGIPHGVSGKALTDALTKRIHLGLDLQGGAHLILRVQVQEAVNAETDNTVANLQQDLQGQPERSSLQARSQPPDGDADRRSCPGELATVRSTLDSKYSNEYDVSTGSNGSFTLTMKPTSSAPGEQTVQQAIETIRDRVDSLGVSEPVIEEYGLGKNQILVELPGISDLDRVKNMIQSTARLEIHAVVGGPYKDEQEALPERRRRSAARRGDAARVAGNMATRRMRTASMCCSGSPLSSGSDFRSADPSTDQNTGQRRSSFTLTNEAGDKFYDYTSKNISNSMAVVMGGRVKEVANIKSAIRDPGEIRRQLSARTKLPCSPRCCAPARCRPR